MPETAIVPAAPAPRTLPWVVRYLAREAKAKPPTFVEVEFNHELQRVDAGKELTEQLKPHGIPVREIHLTVPCVEGDDAPVRQLIDMLKEQPDGAMVFVSGFEAVLPPPGSERNRVLAMFNWYRETIVERPLHQVWWVTQGVAASISHAIPDLDSWFLHRLSLANDEKHARAAIDALGWRESEEKKKELLARSEELCQRVDRLKNEGRYFEAAPLVREALRLREAILGADDPDTLRALHSLAVLQWRMGNLEEAEALGRRVLGTRERLLGPEHPDTLTTVNNLALLLRAKGELEGAEALGRRVLEASERLLGPEHPDTLTTVNNLALLLRAKGELEGAEALHRRVLEARERLLGPEHPDTLSTVNNLALLLLVDKGDLKGAEALYRQALGASERLLGPEHPDTLNTVHNLAILLRAKGELEGAEALGRRVLEASERLLGPEHPDTLTTVNNLAILLSDKGNLAGAEALYRRALDAAQRLLGFKHPETSKYRRNLELLLAERRASASDSPQIEPAPSPERDAEYADAKQG